VSWRKGAAVPVAWQRLATFTAAEWNAAIGAGFVDLVTLPTGTIVYDFTGRVSSNFDDSAGVAALGFGWGNGTRPATVNPLQINPDDWAGVSGSAMPHANWNALSELTQMALGDQAYGLPSFVKDAAVAGPVQAQCFGNADATLGTVEVWALVQEGVF